jgi:SAM-dependent methyltransferase
MMDDVTRTLRDIQRGPVARWLLADILELAEREGILERARKLSPVSFEDFCAALHSELGYALGQGNRRRMISLLLSLLAECWRMKEADGVWQWCGDDSTATAGSALNAVENGDASAKADDQYLFFQGCLRAVPAYLRGGAASVQFDERNAGAWERFLGCTEFRSCRALLLVLMDIETCPAPRVLDLCHGPGWGLEAVIRRSWAARITALDFTDAFRPMAQARAELAQARNRQRGQPPVPIIWKGPDCWKGFGCPLPFSDGSFDAVLFTCGDPYIPAALRRDVYREVARVLVPDGTLGVLTRCRPDADGRHVASFWLRISALGHDFAESVCEGWEGFSDAEENMRMFSEAGFQGRAGVPSTMSFLDSSLWVLRKASVDA